MSVNHGSKRITTGAHYGLRDWLAQRITAALMASFFAGLGASHLHQRPYWLRRVGGYFCSPVDEGFDLCHHPFFALPRVDWHTRYLDGLHQTPWFASFLACRFPDLAHRLRWLGCSGLVASLMMFGTD